MQHGIVNGTCIEKKFPSNALDEFDVIRSQFWSGIGVCVLDALSVLWCVVLRWGVEELFGERVLKLFECRFNISVHAANEFAAFIVPFQVDSDVLFRIHAEFDRVLFSNGVDKVVYVRLVRIFDTEVIDNEGEVDVAVFVAEEAGSCGGLMVVVFFEMGNNIFVRDAACFFQTVPCTFDACIHVTIVDFVM